MAGFKIKKYIEQADSQEVLVIKKEVSFNINNIEEYLEKFNELVEDMVIQNTNFNDNEWILNAEFNSTIYIPFCFDIKPNIVLSLKCFAITKIYEQFVTPKTIQNAIKHISRFIIKTNYLNKDFVVQLRDSINSWKLEEKKAIPSIREYLKFVGFDENKEYLDVLNGVAIPKSNTRVIPCYQSILLFDSIIKDFLLTSEGDCRYKFMPLLLWWEITKIIPIRPIEFKILKKNLLSYEEGIQRIHVERRKNKNGRVKYKTIDFLKDIPISKELASLIEEYLDYTKDENTSDYFLSYQTYDRLTNKISGVNKKVDMIVTLRQLRGLLEMFYIEVVSKKYGYTYISKDIASTMDDLPDDIIEIIQLGDTRHIAFCSMMLQGFNPLTIAQIGGHHSLTEQTSYCSHLDSFIKSHTYILAKSMKNKLNINMTSKDLDFNYKSNLLIKEQMGPEYFSLRKITGGRCKSRNFPFECQSSHLYCPNFIADEDVSILLAEREEVLSKDIALRTSFIKNIFKDLIGIQLNDTSNTSIQNELIENCKKLNTSIKQMAISEAYKLKIKEDGFNE